MSAILDPLTRGQGALMDFPWYAVDERGFVAEVESVASPLPSGSLDPFRVAVLQYALHCRPDLTRRLYQYRERPSCEHRTHVRFQLPEAPLTAAELVLVCRAAEDTLRMVAVDFAHHDAFVPEEVIDDGYCTLSSEQRERL